MDLEINLIPASNSDVRFYFELKNDKKVLAASFNSNKVNFETHKKWFFDKLSSKDTFLYLICLHNHKVGQIRLDVQNNVGEISISIIEKYRGKGISPAAIKILSSLMFKKILGLKKIIAKIKTENLYSKKVFLKAGFKVKNFTSLKSGIVYMEMLRPGRK